MPYPKNRRSTFESLLGKKFSRLTVTAFVGRDSRKAILWFCSCDCGREVVCSGPRLKSGNTKSCGCLRAMSIRKALTTHGHRSNGSATPEYNSWRGMMWRCRASSGKFWNDYGSRGIIVCERWQSFENFLADTGPRPPGKTLDRKENDGNYEPSNCRWATVSEQNANQRRSKKRNPELALAAGK